MMQWPLILAVVFAFALISPARPAAGQEKPASPAGPAEEAEPGPTMEREIRLPETLPAPEPEFCDPIPLPRKKTPGEKETILERSAGAIEDTHERISARVNATARWIDSFFSDERIESETEKSRLRLRVSAFAEEENAVQYDFRAKVRLSLPVLTDKLHLLITGDPEEEEEDFAPLPLQEVREQFADPGRTEDVSASLRYFLVARPERNFSLRGGIRLRSGVPTPFVEPRFRQNVPFDPWLFRFTQRVIWLIDDSLEVRTTFDLERQLFERFLFRTTLQGSWFRDEDGYFYQLGFTLFQPLCFRRVLEYDWIQFFQTSPNHRLEELQLRVRYRQRLYWDWLYFEVAPQVAFPHDLEYRATPGILLRLEVVFGEYFDL